MAKRHGTGAMALAMNSWAAGFEAQQVIALRLAKLALGGPAASKEAHLMVDEKVRAAIKANHAATRSVLAGDAAGVPAMTLAGYRRTMRANRRRLVKELFQPAT